MSAQSPFLLSTGQKHFVLDANFSVDVLSSAANFKAFCDFMAQSSPQSDDSSFAFHVQNRGLPKPFLSHELLASGGFVIGNLSKCIFSRSRLGAKTYAVFEV
jgi:hypothetical protein